MSRGNIRFQQLRYILEKEFDNNRGKLAEKLNISTDALSKYVSNGKKRRDISDTTARRFEKTLGREVKFLDQSQNTNVYYVTVTFTGRHPSEFLKNLRSYELVKEASMQYGEADIFIKIEGSEQDCQALIFNNIRQFSGVTKTTTSQALNTSRWQRSQHSYYRITEEPKLPNRLLQKYIDIKRKELYTELSDLDKGKKVTIHNRYEINTLTYDSLLKSAEYTIKTTLSCNPRTIGWLKEDFFKSHNKINPIIKRKILLFTKHPMSHEVSIGLSDFMIALKKENNIEVQIMDERDWIGDAKNRIPITLTIVDDLITSILYGESFTLVYQGDVVGRYSRLFDTNWNSAKDEGSF